MSKQGLICQDLYKSYKENVVLRDVNLTLERGKIYGMIGRNGAGKTTLLSCMSAQRPVSKGTVTLDGQAVWENQEVLDHICFSRELSAAALTSNRNGMKVKEYLRTAAIFFPNWDQNLADLLVKKFQLDVKKRLMNMSKGMLSMVTIIVALASKAEFTFLDEPTSGLDVVMRDFFYKVLLDEFSKSGRTFVISTHIIEEAADIFEEVILIKDGEILLKENTNDLVSRGFKVSGLDQVVEEATRGYHCYHKEHIGRGTGVTILLEEGQQPPRGFDLTVQPLNLQNVFIALCGLEGDYASLDA